MITNGVLTQLQRGGDADTDALNAFKDRLKSMIVNKNTIILDSGQICDRLYFLEKGLVRGFYKHSGKEITSWFAWEDCLFHASESFLYQIPSVEIIEALEDCEISYILRSDLYELYQSFPSINSWGRTLAENEKIIGQKTLLDMQMHIAKDRLISFASKNRGLFLRVPQKHIASHIGVSEGYISELMGRIKL